MTLLPLECAGVSHGSRGRAGSLSWARLRRHLVRQQPTSWTAHLLEATRCKRHLKRAMLRGPDPRRRWAGTSDPAEE